MGLLSLLTVIPGIGKIIGMILGFFKKSSLEKAYDQADKAQKGEAQAQEQVARLSREQASIELRKKDFDDFFNEEDY